MLNCVSQSLTGCLEGVRQEVYKTDKKTVFIGLLALTALACLIAAPIAALTFNGVQL